jgi:hypothetical protein
MVTGMAEEIRERLVAAAFLYDDPAAYVAGVDAALRAAASVLPPGAGSKAAPETQAVTSA